MVTVAKSQCFEISNSLRSLREWEFTYPISDSLQAQYIQHMALYIQQINEYIQHRNSYGIYSPHHQYCISDAKLYSYTIP